MEYFPLVQRLDFLILEEEMVGAEKERRIKDSEKKEEHEVGRFISIHARDYREREEYSVLVKEADRELAANIPCRYEREDKGQRCCHQPGDSPGEKF